MRQGERASERERTRAPFTKAVQKVERDDASGILMLSLGRA